MKLELKRRFFDLLMIQKKKKDEIVKLLELSEDEYIYLRRIAKEWDKMKIDTELVETRVKRKFIVNPDDVDNWKDLMKIWETKHKVPANKNILDFEV